ncbi:MAG: diguanylate cyclase [Rhodobacteraceae bacterium]|nr:diguanylate cyclase [Paracoccaceae bacterium]
MSDEDDFKRTIFYGESAVSYIKKNTLPAYPRAYEFWYTYSAGYNSNLNREINTILKSEGRVSASQVEALYAEHLAPERIGDRLTSVGSKISQEVGGLVEAIKQNASAASDYGSSLEKAGAQLDNLKDPKKLEQFVASMVEATKTALSSSQKLESQLMDSQRQIEDLQNDLDSIRFESLTDELTTLGNRRQFDQALNTALSSSEQNGSHFVLMLTDIDHFKVFNDTYGHQTGDQVLRLVAMTTKQNVKPSDTPCRYGGEEFGVVLEQVSLDQAYIVAERIRQAVMAKELIKRSTGENLGRITISIGLAEVRKGDTSETIVERADMALYAAKHAGRNLVKTERDLTDFPGKDTSQVA